MLHTEGVVGLVTGMLAARMPDKIGEKRALLSVTPAQLPQIKRFRPVVVGKAAASDYPALYVVAQQNPATKSQQKDRFGVQYAITYQLTVVTLVRSTSAELTTLMQQRIASAVKECLLQSMQLRPLDGDDSARIEQDSLRERFSGIESYGGRDTATYGGCMTDLTVTAQEYLPRLAPQGGTVNLVVDFNLAG